MKIFSISALAVVWSCLSADALQYQAQAPLSKPGRGNPFTESLITRMNETLREHKVPGMAIAVVDEHDIYTQGFGFATLPDVPVTSDTLWCVGSTTKAFTAATISSLIHQKQHPLLQPLGWQTPISSLIRDDFVLQDEWAMQHLTLEDAVSHRTGFPRHDLSYATFDAKGKRLGIRDVVRNLRNLPATLEPRVKFQYCNLMFMALSHVVETILGQKLVDVFREMIWSPLNMTSTYLGFEEAQKHAKKRIADGYYFDQVDDEFKYIPPMSLEEISGAGAILSSATDYGQWIHMLLYQGEPFSAKVHEDIQTPRMLQDVGGNSPYGLGWDKENYHGHRQYSHSGGTDAFVTQMYWFPDEKYGIVAFSNTNLRSHEIEEEVLHNLIDQRFGIEDEKRASRPDQVEKSTFSTNKGYHYPYGFTAGADEVYPLRPSQPLPLPVNISSLAGSYTNEGYGTLKLAAEAVPEQSPRQTISSLFSAAKEPDTRLIARRPEMTWRYDMDFRHVSGMFFAGSLVYPHNPSREGFDHISGEFKTDVKGRVTGLWVEMDTGGFAPASTMRIWFAREA